VVNSNIQFKPREFDKTSYFCVAWAWVSESDIPEIGCIILQATRHVALYYILKHNSVHEYRYSLLTECWLNTIEKKIKFIERLNCTTWLLFISIRALFITLIMANLTAIKPNMSKVAIYQRLCKLICVM